MIVTGPSLIDDVLSWFAARKAVKLKARKAKERQLKPKVSTPKRPAKRAQHRKLTAKEWRDVYGVPPAIRIINGGKS